MLGFLAEGPSAPPYRIPAYGEYAGEGFFPIEYLPKQYRYYMPYVVSVVGTVDAGGAKIVTYQNPSDSDFIIIKQMSVSTIDATTNRILLYPDVLVTMRIGAGREFTSEPVAFDLLFPDRHYTPFYWDVPLIVEAGGAIEISLTNTNTTTAFTLTMIFSGIRGYS